MLRSDLFGAVERDVLLDAAEGLLLMRSPDPVEIRELEADIDATLTRLILAGRIHATTAAELRKRIRECGPQTDPVAA
jgi:hypothetical protein